MHKYESAYKILDNLYNNINFNNDNEAMYAISIRINLAIALAYISQTDKAKKSPLRSEAVRAAVSAIHPAMLLLLWNGQTQRPVLPKAPEKM